MKIIIWGTGHMSRLIENYIKHDIEIVAYVDNNAGGGYIATPEREVAIIGPNNIKNIVFDYCLIAVKECQSIIDQCLYELGIPKEKIIKVIDVPEWNASLLNSIFDENILSDPRNYRVENIKIDLGEGHALPLYQKLYKMYDRFIPYLAQITKRKEGKYIIDIGANVGDTLAAMWNHTDDNFLCIEPVGKFFELLNENIQHLGCTDRVCTEQAFVTDRMDETYRAEISEKGTAVKKQAESGVQQTIPSKTVDYLIQEKGIEYKDIDLLKIDTDGFDADCIISAFELLKNGNTLIYWENYNETYEQYKKYLDAYRLLDSMNYSVFFIFDNYGNYLCRGGIDTINSVLDYMQRVNTGCIGDTFRYFDVLACKTEDIALCEKFITQYLSQYLLYRIKK